MTTVQAKVRNAHRRATLGPQMPKTTVELEEAIRFRMSKEDKRAFEAAAAKMRISVSAWLRLAALEKIEREQDRERERKASK
jgi:hypothetical protein